jgi:hypothetical protein
MLKRLTFFNFYEWNGELVKFVLSAAGLCLSLLSVMPLHAKTITLQYDIAATFDDEFARTLYYQDPSDLDPYSTPIACSQGRDCYPDDWRPRLSVSRGFELGEIIRTTLNISLAETTSGYSIQSLTSSGDLTFGIRTFPGEPAPWASLGRFDAQTGDIGLSIYNGFSAGWGISLAGGTGALNYATEYGASFGASGGSACFYDPRPGFNFPGDFCDAYDAEAIFIVNSYQVQGLPLAQQPPQVPLSASALFLLSAAGGLALRSRRSARS